MATHAGATAFFSWPEFGEMLGGRFDEHPWGITDATVVVEDRASPITAHLPPSFVVNDEHYQLKDFSRSKLHVLARLDASRLDLKAPLVHRTDGDFPVAWTKSYGAGPGVLLDPRPPPPPLGRGVDAADVRRGAEVGPQAVSAARRPPGRHG